MHNTNFSDDQQERIGIIAEGCKVSQAKAEMIYKAMKDGNRKGIDWGSRVMAIKAGKQVGESVKLRAAGE